MCFKEHCQENEKTTQRRDKIFINYLPDKGLVSRIHKVHLQLITKPHFSKENIPMTNKHMKRLSTSLGIKVLKQCIEKDKSKPQWGNTFIH